MLAFVIGLQYGEGPIKCDKGYYNYRNEKCVTKEECTGADKWYVFEK